MLPTDTIAAQPGTYVLVLVCKQHTRRQVGKWGLLLLKPGYYSYIGSAFGSGGVKARVSRHCRKDKAMRWHIDYLSGICVPREIWYSYDKTRLEHHWAESFGRMKSASPVSGFGCSDCSCDAHLFYTASNPCATEFRGISGDSLCTTVVT